MVQFRIPRATAIIGAAVAVTIFGSAPVALAAKVSPKPSSVCKVPVFSVSSTTAHPGTRITVTGQNFSGCFAEGNPAKPTPVLTVKVGVYTAAKVQDILATTKTSANGSFSVQITIPTVPNGGQPQIAIAAVSSDPATKVVYTGFKSINYTEAANSPGVPATTSGSTPTSTVTSSTQSSFSSSVDMPTAVPAGTGGFGAPTSTVQRDTELVVGAAGMALIALGGFGMARHRTRQH